MKTVRKATGTGAGCACFVLAGGFGLVGLFLFPPLLVLAIVFGVFGLYLGSKAAKFWRCRECRAEIARG